MAVEAIKCPNCGSAEVTEFKSGSYVCTHCEGTFKYVDPQQPTVTMRPDFCRCGNIVRAQCGTCQSGICSQCTSDNRLDYEDPLTSIGGWFTLVAVRPGGYEFQVGRPEMFQRYGQWRDLSLSTFTATGVMLQCRKWALDDGEWQPLRVDPSGHACGYVSSVKVWGHLSRTGAKGHLCLPCFSAAAARVRDEVIRNAVCMNPFCGRAASASCPCCGEANCGRCLFESIEGARVPAEFIRKLSLPGGEGVSIEAPAVCALCYCEYTLTPEELRTVPISPLRSTSNRALEKQAREMAAARQQTTQRAAAVSSRWRQDLQRGCRRPEDQRATVHYRLMSSQP